MELNDVPARYTGRGRIARDYSRRARETAADNRRQAEAEQAANAEFKAAMIRLFAAPEPSTPPEERS